MMELETMVMMKLSKTTVWKDGTGTETARGQKALLHSIRQTSIFTKEGPGVSIAAYRTNLSRRRQSFDHASLATHREGNRDLTCKRWSVCASVRYTST